MFNKLFAKAGSLQVFIALIAIIAGFVYYYAVYIPGQEKRIMRDRYQRMERQQININKKKAAYFDLLKQYIDYGDLSRLADNQVKKDSIIDYTYQKLSIIDDSLFFRSKKDTQRVCIKVSLKDFFEPIFDKSSFNEFLLSNKKEEIYSTIAAAEGLNLDNILDKASLKPDSINKRMVNIGANEYLAFVQSAGIKELPDLKIIGLLDKDDFLKESRSFSEETFSLFFIILCLILLSLPSVKLMVLGTNERLRYKDLFSSYITIILLVSCAFLIFSRMNFNLCSYFYNDNCNNEDSKVILSNSISKEFKNDLGNAVSLLKAVNKSSNNFLKIAKRRTTDSLIYQIPSGSFIIRKKFQNIFWIDKNGIESLRLTKLQSYSPRANYANRKYFSDLFTNSGTILNNDTDKISFEAVISRTDNTFKPVIAMKVTNDSLAAIAMSFRMSSVQDAILPAGFGFAIFDKNGEVVFHSDSTKNLNENFLFSSNNNVKLKQILIANQTGSFKDNYNNKPHNVYVKPLDAIPGYYMAVFSDESYTNYANYGALLICLFITGIVIAFYIVEVLLLHLGIYKRNIIKGNVFDFNILFPRRAGFKNYIFYGINYLLASVLFLFIFFSTHKWIGWIASTHNYSDNISKQLLVFSDINNNFCFVYLIYAMLLNMFFTSMVPLLTLIRILNRSNEKTNHDKLIFLKKTLKWFSLGLSLVFISSFLSGTYIFVLIYALYLLLVYNISRRISPLVAKLFLNTKELSYQKKESIAIHSYAFMVYMRMLLLAGVSIAGIYTISFNYSQVLLERYRLYDYAERYSAISNKSDPLNKSDLHAYKDLTWISSVSDNDSCKDFKPHTLLNREIAFRNRILSFVTELHPGLAALTAFDRQENELAHGNYKFKINGEERSFSTSFNDKSICITGKIPTTFSLCLLFTKPTGFSYIISFVLFLTVLFWLVRLSCGRYFNCSQFNIPIEDRNKKILLDENIHNIFIQGIPGLSKYSLIKTIFDEENKARADRKEQEFEIIKIDLPSSLQNLKADHIYEAASLAIKSRKLFDTENIIVIVNHFEFDFEKPESNIFKLILLEKLLAIKLKKLVIISTIDQNEFLRMQFDSGVKLNEIEQNSILKLKFRWRSVLGAFVNIYFSSKKIKSIPDITDNPFLKNIEPYIYGRKNPSDFDIMIREDLAYHYYQQIWSTLAREEKLILMSLSNDGILNFKNEYYVGMLFQKGLLVVVDDRAVIFDSAFSNFILTVADKKDAERLETELSKGQGSANFSYPLIALALGLIWLILYSNPDRYSGLLPLVSSMSAGIVTILTLVRTFSPAGKSK